MHVTPGWFQSAPRYFMALTAPPPTTMAVFCRPNRFKPATLCLAGKANFLSQSLSCFSRRRIYLASDTMGDTPSFDFNAIRAIYKNREQPHLIEEELPTRNPFSLFDIWFRNVAIQKNLSYEEVNAVCLSTVGADLRPSSRMVLMKDYDGEGFTFYTHRTSKKGSQLGENPNAAMLFYWPAVHRQIRIEGTIRELPDSEAQKYWKSRPLPSRIGSKSSKQSTVVTREQLLTTKIQLEALALSQGEEAISKPEAWIGFKLQPRYFEFWQGQSDRLHDRIIFDTEKKLGEACADGWWMYRLSP